MPGPNLGGILGNIFGQGGGVYGATPAPGLIDPLTGRSIDVSGLREGASTGGATIAHGFALDTVAAANRGRALATLRGSVSDPLLQQLNATASRQLVNPTSTFDENLIRRIFARSADSAGANARGMARTISSTLGGRGISASSPLAAGLASQVMAQKSGALRGAQADITIAKLQSDVQQRALAFQQALAVQQQNQGIQRDIASLEGQDPSTFGYDSMQGLTEAIMERQAQEAARQDGKKASKNNLIGSIVGGVLGIGAALI